MKKLLLVLVNFALLSTVFSQGGIFLGPRFGAGYNSLHNANWVNPEGSDNMVSEEGELGLLIGAELGYHFWNTDFAIKSGFFSKQYKYILNVDGTATGIERGSYSMSVTEIPLLLHMNFVKKSSSNRQRGGVYLEAGAQLDLINGMTIRQSNSLNITDFKDFDVTEKYISSGLSAIFGFGFVQLQTDRVQISHTLRATYGLQDILLDKDYSFFQPVGNFRGWSDEYKPTRMYSISYMFTVNFRIYNRKKH